MHPLIPPSIVDRGGNRISDSRSDQQDLVSGGSFSSFKVQLELDLRQSREGHVLTATSA